LSKDKKIPIQEFISEKKLNKILDIIKKSDDVEMNYDRIEMLLDDDFNVKDLGTNRIVFIHKKKKYSDYIFKVAGDSHGIEANFREFYNGDLDKHLTFSYSISKNGVFVVQEKVTRLTKDTMKEYKKDVREMLHVLSKKILLVDCKLTNFKNFGIRKNGKVCLLDHGDTVPLPKYQGNEIINVDEESYVSLKCKRMLEASAETKKLKQCCGKLKYSKNFDSLICENCGAVSAINDAYREFYGDKRIGSIKGSSLMLDKDFDPDEWKAHIEEYCIETMSHANIKNNNKKGDSNMKTKTINGTETVQVKGFWLPEPTNAILSNMYNSVRIGKVKPVDYLKAIGVEDVDDYKVRPIDHGDSSNVKNTVNPLNLAATRLIEKAESTGEFENKISYIEAANICGNIDFGNMKNIAALRNIMAADDKTAGVVYTEDGFSIRVKSAFNNNVKRETRTFEPFVSEKGPDNEFIVDEESEQETEMISEFVNDEISESEIETIDDKDYVEDYSKTNNSTIVDDIEDEPTSKGLVLSSDDIENAITEFNGEECVVIGKYAVPVSIIDQYLNEENGLYELPDKKMKLLIKSHNLSPKKYKLSNAQSIDEEIASIDENSIEIPEIKSDEIIEDSDESVDEELEVIEAGETIFDINNSEMVSDVCETVTNLAKESKSKDRFGYCYINPLEIIINCFKDKNLALPKNEYYTEKKLDESNIEIAIDPEQMNNLYKLFINIFEIYGTEYLESSPSAYYEEGTLGFLLSEFKDDRLEIEEQYKRSRNSYLKNPSENSIPFNLIESVLELNNSNTVFLNNDGNLYCQLSTDEENVFGRLEDFFIMLYDNTDDTEIYNNTVDKDIVKDWINAKREFYCENETFAKLQENLNPNTVFHLIRTALEFARFTASHFENSDVEFLDTFTDYYNDLEDDIFAFATETDDSDDSELLDNDYEINSDNDSNLNNKENEEEFDLTNNEVIDALRILTDSINKNNELLSQELDITRRSLDRINAIDKKLDNHFEANSSDEMPGDEMPGDEMPNKRNLTYSLDTDGDGRAIISFDINDLENKIFIVNHNGKALVLDLHALSKTAIDSTDDEYINVISFKTNALN